MPSNTCWKELRKILGRMRPAEGEQGFEGLVRALFEAVTGKSFYLARKGDQPVGDIFGPRAGVALEAKCYSSRALPSEREIEGEIDEALRKARLLDVFVVVATKPLAQLAARLAQKTRETGLDILPLHLGDGLSEFGALCVAHWQVVSDFIPGLAGEWQKWAAEEAAKADTKAALQRLVTNLQGLTTQTYVAEEAGQKLEERFRGEGAGARVHNRVVLSEAIHRKDIEKKVSTWWLNRDAPIAVLEGKDGMGKTWVAASFVQYLIDSEAPVAFWLDSLAWKQAPSIAGLIRTALESVFFANDDLRERITRKIAHLWPQPVLLILDGANERGAWETAEVLLRDFQAHDDSRYTLRDHVRLLFTSRPHYNRPDFWDGYCVIPVDRFDEVEFRTALAKAAPGLTPEDLTHEVREWAVIPLYFRLCLRLREQLSSLQHLTKPLLLWAELEEKRSRGDPQVATLEKELQGGLDEVLAHLAQQVGWARSSGASLATEELQRVFPNLLKVRSDLIERRIVREPTSFDITTLDSDHVVLGQALILRRQAQRNANESLDHLRDLLQRELEPAGADDDKVRAIHVATLLAFLDKCHDPYKTQTVRASLFSLWVSHRNARVDNEALQFFTQSDLAAYVQAVEFLFCDHLPGGLESALLEPLARMWRDQIGDIGSIRETLQHWLRLIFPGGAGGSKDGDEQPPPDFVLAKSAAQLRLSYAAVGVISFRPEPALLPTLLDSQRSYDFCYVERGTGQTKHRWSAKSPHEALGVLLRWSYTESVLADLRTLSDRLTPGSKAATNLLWFARLLRMAELPGQIGLAEDICPSGRERSKRLVERLIRSLQKAEPLEREVFGFGMAGCLAVRRDLPEMESQEVQALCTKVQQCAALGNPPVSYPGTWENRQLHDMLPWVARYAPGVFDTVCLALWQQVLDSKESVAGLMDLDELIPGEDAGGQLVQTVLRNATALLGHRNYEAGVATLTELIALHGSLDQILEWLDRLEDRVFEGTKSPIICLDPIPNALQTLAPPGLAEKARERLERAWANTKMSSDEKCKRIAGHWLQVYSYTVEPTKEAAEWALALAAKAGPDESLRFPLFHLLCGCTNTDVLLRTLELPVFRTYHLGFNAWRWGRGISPKTGAPSFDQLKSKTSFTVSGLLLEQANLDEELRKWGQNLADTALAVLEMGEVEMMSNTNAEARAELAGFNASGPLLRWSQLEPAAFTTFAEKFLQQLWRKCPTRVVDFHHFAQSIAIGLLRLWPELALSLSVFKGGSFRVQLIVFGSALNWETQELWSPEFNTIAKFIELRRQVTADAPNDEVLFWHVAAARARENAEQIARLASDWLKQPKACDRALGVTLLAFLGDGEYIPSLSERIAADPSFWIREHAAWALDVCELDLACKQRYREVLKSGSIKEVAHGLAELRMSFSPMAQVWRHLVEREVGLAGKNSRINAYLDIFWSHWGSISSRKDNFGILGRKLREYCRGEPLKEGVTSRQFPWWRLQD